MQQLNTGKVTGGEKFVRLALLGGLIFGGIKLFNSIAPDIIQLMKNIWWMIGLGVPLAFLTLYVISNPVMVWMQYKRLCRLITSGFIKMDPLSIMKGYLEYIVKKKSNLDNIRVKLQGREVKLERMIADLNKGITTNKKLGQAALTNKDTKQASQYGNFIAADKQSLELYTPLYDRIHANRIFLDELSENWGYSIESLAREIDRKEEEYKALKEAVRALKEAQSFAEANEATRLYQESLKALEENVSQKIAYIQDFETKSKKVMSSINNEKAMRSAEGMEALKELKDESFKLPADFSITNKLSAADIAYETLPKDKFNL